jgi:integrase
MIVRRNFPQIYELEHPKNGRYWLVSARSAKWGMNERKTFPQKSLAVTYAGEIEKRLITFGKQPDIPKEKIQAALSYENLMAKLESYGRTPEEAVGHFLNHLGNEVTKQAKPFVRDLVEEWAEFKFEDQTMSEKYKVEIHSYARFIKNKWGDLKPDDLKRNDIDLLIKGLKVRNNSRRKYLRFIRMFFSWVKDEGHLQKNPTDGIKYKPDDFNADFYDPDTTKKLLRYIVEHEKDLVGYFALLTFAGLRPTEGERVQWGDYRPKTDELYVRKGKTNARYITLKPAAVEWMNFHRNNTPAGSPFVRLENLENRLKKIRRVVLGDRWIQDGLRTALFADLDVGTFSRPNYFSHLGNLILNITGKFRHFRRHITERKEFLRINFAVPDKLVVDVANEAPANFYSGFGEHPRLKCQVGNVNVLQ